jgi:hypothetical protein
MTQLAVRWHERLEVAGAPGYAQWPSNQKSGGYSLLVVVDRLMEAT